jgi:hypothetical protein
MQRTIITIACVTMLGGGPFVTLSNAGPPLPSVVDNLTACRKITESAARLACYDDRVDKISAASSTGGLVVLDRQQVHEARRSLFGFTIPKLPFLEERQPKPDRKVEEADSQIDSTIRTARQLSPNEWRIVLDDGAVWQTSEAPNVDPNAGDPIHIKRAALGSYLANIHGQRAVRIRRVG